MKSIKTLEFDKILDILASYADSEYAKQLILETVPSDDKVIIDRLQDETTAAFELVTHKSRPPLGRSKDIRQSIERAVKGAVLTTAELLSVASLLRSAAAVKKYGAHKSGEETVLDPYFAAITPLPVLTRSITDSIIAEDMIADTASDKLLKIRKDIKRCESNVKDALASFISGPSSKYLQEAIVTTRGGRYVVPVRNECKSQVNGIVHDTSASGSTVFVEPMAVLEANNKLRELHTAEEAEIERILYDLSQSVAAASASITTSFDALNRLSVIFARAYFSADYICTRPVIGSNKIKLVHARHPLIPKDKVVANTIEFGGNVRTMIITGPNTGGKTVTLKTIGLLSMMAQSGMHVPADYGTELPVFSNILADIGDEQSIEQSLSTFSSHMSNIVKILTECDERTLVLFDELGAGTDPVEGASLAMAILETTKSMGAMTVATTHYSELKIYAIENTDVLNASCEFDVNTLRPTYRLITGLPGKSNAFAISLRLGLSPGIIDRARELTDESDKKLEDVLSRLQEAEIALRNEQQQAAKLKSDAEAKLAAAEKKSADIQAKADAELQKAQLEAQKMLAKARAASDYVMSQVTELQKAKDKQMSRAMIDDARRAMREQLKSADDALSIGYETDDAEYTPPRPFKPGDEIIMADIGKNGIIKAISGDTATVQAGIMQVKTPVSNLRLVEAKSKPKQKGTSSYSSTLSAFKPEIDVRGENGDDAWFMIDSFLDSAMLSTFETVTVIHGKGTGALRNALWNYFKRDKRIASFRSGRYGEGETGVTIITLKK